MVVVTFVHLKAAFDTVDREVVNGYAEGEGYKRRN